MSNDDESNEDLLPATQEGRKSSWTLLQTEDSPAKASLVEELRLRRRELQLVTVSRKRTLNPEGPVIAAPRTSLL